MSGMSSKFTVTDLGCGRNRTDLYLVLDSSMILSIGSMRGVRGCWQGTSMRMSRRKITTMTMSTWRGCSQSDTSEEASGHEYHINSFYRWELAILRSSAEPTSSPYLGFQPLQTAMLPPIHDPPHFPRTQSCHFKTSVCPPSRSHPHWRPWSEMNSTVLPSSSAYTDN